MLKNISFRSLRVWQRNFDVLMETWYLTLLPPILEPIMYVLAFGFGLGQMIDHVLYMGQTWSYLEFMSPGVIAVAIMFWAYFETTYPTFVRMFYQKTFDAILSTPLLAEDVIAGELLWGATKSMMAATIMTVVLSAMGLLIWPSALWIFPGAVLGGILFSSLGLITTALSPSIDTFNLPIFILIFPMFMFSGTFFPLDVLPEWASAIAHALPLTHVSNLVRAAALGQPMKHFYASWIYLLVATPLLATLAVYQMKKKLVN